MSEARTVAVTVVDAHVHLLPGRLGEKVRQVFAPLADDLAYPAAHDAVREQLRSEGVDEAWTLPYAHRPGVAEWLNEQTALIVATPGPVTLIGGATTHPGDVEPAAIVRRAVDEHGAQVLKLHCSVGDFDAGDERLDDVWDAVSTLGLPVVVHVGHATNGQTSAADLAPVGAVATRFPDARIIVAHCGHPDVDAALDLLEQHPHVFADLTPVMTAAPIVPAERLADVADKLLFGSDAPNVTISAADRLATIRALPLDSESIAAIIGGTARRLRMRLA